MSKLTKILLGACGALAFICFVFYKALGNVHDDTPVPVVYPVSGLSDDLFVSQNTEYKANESLPIIYAFSDVPYLVDLPDGNTADVGTGHIVSGNESTCFYVSQIEDTINPHDAVLTQYPKVVYINYSQDSSYAQTVLEEKGYLNGMTATYFVDHLLISTGSTQSARNAYVLGYCFDLGEDYPYNVILSVATTLETSEAFENCKTLLDMLAYTFRYDEDLDKKQISEREKLAKEAEKAAKEAAEAEEKAKQKAEKEAEDALKAQMEEAEASRLDGIRDEKQLPVMVTKDFKNLTILVSWTEENKDADITFQSEDGLIYVKPTTSSSKQAIIDVGTCKAGQNYYLSISPYGKCGDVSMKLIENS